MWTKEKRREYRRQWYLDHKEEENERDRIWRMNHCDKVSEYNVINYENKIQWRKDNQNRLNIMNRQYRKDDPERYNLYMRRARNRRKYRLMFMLCNGEPKCKWCDESKLSLLNLDHINGDGWYDRKVRKLVASTEMIRFYLNNPEMAINKLQVLCYSCHKEKTLINGDRTPDMSIVVDQYQKKLIQQENGNQ